MEEEEVKYLDYEGLVLYHQNLQNVLDQKVNSSDLADVATSGNYNDLINKPTNIGVFNNDVGYLTDNSDTICEILDTLEEKANQSDLESLEQIVENNEQVTSAALTNLEETKANKSDLEDLEQTITDNEQVIASALNNLNETKADKTDLNAIEQTIEDNELVVSTTLNNLKEKSLISVVNITTDTSSSCTITGVSNSEREQLIIYRNTSGSSDLIVTVPTIYFTPNGQPIELVCKIGGYCEVNYINVDGNIYARGL